jgi:hypothetical protein
MSEGVLIHVNQTLSGEQISDLEAHVKAKLGETARVETSDKPHLLFIAGAEPHVLVQTVRDWGLEAQLADL